MTAAPNDAAVAREIPPLLEIERLLLVVTGSIAAAEVPSWARWIRDSYPALQVQAVLTPMATRFVSEAVLSAHLGAPVHLDRWAASVPPRPGAGRAAA